MSPAGAELDQPTSFRSDKLVVARALARTPWHAAARAVEKKLRLMRVFNYHGTPRRHAASFGAQIDHLLARYDAVDPHRLGEALAAGPPRGRSLAVFTFDDGLRTHFDVAADELEQRGARGIFCVPAEFPSVRPADQPGWFRRRMRPTPSAEHAADAEMCAMTWPQVRDLVARGHRICSHSLTHEVLTADTPARTLEAEIVESRKRLEDELGVAVDSFCWPSDRDPRAARAAEMVAETYSYALVGNTKPLRPGHDPLDVNRTRLEASWPLEAVDFQVSGLIDGVFVLRRLRSALAR